MDLVLQIVFQIHLADKYVIWLEESALALFMFTHATRCHSYLSIDSKKNVNHNQAPNHFSKENGN